MPGFARDKEDECNGEKLGIFGQGANGELWTGIYFAEQL